MAKNNLPSGAEITAMVKNTFGTNNPTPEQLRYVMTMLQPSSYILDKHEIRGHGLTFSIPGRDSSKAQSHRPWQKAIIDDKSTDKIVMKSRQLGLSEIGVAEMIWFVDRYSEDAVKALYTFPTNRQLEGFVQTRLNPVLHKGYYSTILNPNQDSMKTKQIRNSFMIFRSSSKAGAVEGE